MGLKADIQALHSSALVAYYPCDDATGSVVADASGNGQHLTVSGSPTFGVAGPAGDAIEFDATATPEQYASGPTPFASDLLPDAWTVFWITRRDTEEAANQTYYWGLGDSVETDSIAGAFNGTAESMDSVRWLIRGSDGVDRYHETSTFAHTDLTKWHCYAMTYDGDNYRFYVNGTEDLSVTIEEEQGTIFLDEFAINWVPGTTDNGRMIQAAQHYALWDRALTWREIRDLYFSACGDDDDTLLTELTRSADDLLLPTNAYTDAVLADGGTLFRLSEPAGHWFFDTDDTLGEASAGGTGEIPGLFVGEQESANFTWGGEARSGPVNGGTYQSHTEDSAAIEFDPRLLDADTLPFSIELWMRFTEFPGNKTPVSFASASSPFVRVRQVVVGGTNFLRLQISDGTNLENSGLEWPDLTNWHHVVIVVEPTGSRLYIDTDKHTQSQTWTTGAFGAINKLNLNGRTQNDGASYTEQPDFDAAELAFYPGVALTDEQVATHFASANDTPDPDPDPDPPTGTRRGLLGGIIGSGYF